MVAKRLLRLTRNPLIRDGAPLLGLYWLYSSIRWLIARDSPYEAFQNAYRVIQLEAHLGIFREQAIQNWLVNHALSVVKVANEFYTIGYFPVLILCGALLYYVDIHRFLLFKSTFLLGLGFALVCFSVFPLAPPRMLPDLGFVDTQQAFGSSLYNRKSMLSFYNPYAAMPSLHFGWALLVGLMAHSFKHRLLKLFGLLYPSCMAFVIVTTGHHYFLDILGGGVTVLLAYAVVKAFPQFANELTASSSRAGGYLSFARQLAVPQGSAHHRTEHGRFWSKEQQDSAQRRRLRYTTMAMLTNRRPPI